MKPTFPMVLTPLLALLASASAACAEGTNESPAHASSTAAAGPIGAQLFAYEDLKQAGKITFSPGFSPDGQTLYFTQADCQRIWKCPQELFVATRAGKGWSYPQKVAVTAGERVEWPSFSPDGRFLLFSWATDRARHRGNRVDVDFDLYRMRLDQERARPEPLDEPDINRIRGNEVRTLRFVHNETAPSLTQSGDLYFWTERLDGIGRRDVYLAPSDKSGGFLRSRPLPSPVNSKGDDSGSWVRPDGRVMLVSYADRGGEGAGDIFVSIKRDDEWGVPRNIGAPANSPYSDFAARITPDGKHIVFTSDRPVASAEAGLFQVWTVPVAELPELQAALAQVTG